MDRRTHIGRQRDATTNIKSRGLGPGATGSHSCYPIDPHVLPKASAKQSNERFRATATVRGVLNSYRALLVYEHDEHYRVDHFSDRYASFEGQLVLAESILLELPALKSGKRNKIRRGLMSLVGEITLGQAEKRVYLPEGMRDAEDGHTRRVVEMLKAANEGERPMRGLLSELVSSQNDSKAHVSLLEQTLTVFEDMLKVVRP